MTMLGTLCQFYGASPLRAAPMALAAASPRARVHVERSVEGFSTRTYQLILMRQTALTRPDKKVWYREGSDEDEHDDDDRIVERDVRGWSSRYDFRRSCEERERRWHRCDIWPEGLDFAHLVRIHQGDPRDGGISAAVLAASWWLCKCAPLVPIFLDVQHVCSLAALPTAEFAAHVWVVDCFECTRSGLTDLSPLGACPALRTLIAPDDVEDLAWASACPQLEQVRLYCEQTANVGSALETCQKLRHVHLLGSAGGDAEWVSRCTSLRFLSFDSVPVVDNPHLFDQLGVLDEVDFDVRELSTLQALGACQTVREAALNGCVSSEGLSAFTSVPPLPLLTDLFIQNFRAPIMQWVCACASLTRLSFSNCNMSGCDALARLPHLRSLSVSWVRSFRLAWLAHSRTLEELEVDGVDGLSGFDGLRNHLGLRKFAASRATVDSFQWLCSCPSLESLNLSDCFGNTNASADLTHASANHPRLRKLHVEVPRELAWVTHLATWIIQGATHLTYLSLRLPRDAGGPLAAAVRELKKLKQLVTFSTFDLNAVSDAPPAVVRIKIDDNATLTSLGDSSATAYRSPLRVLMLKSLPALCDATVLGCAHALVSLAIELCPALATLPSLASLSRLQFLSLADLSLNALPQLPVGLRYLHLQRCDVKSGDWSALGSLTSLEWLGMDAVNSLTDLSCLASCRSLWQLTVSQCAALVDISALGALPQLHELTLTQLSRVASLKGLHTCVSLQTMRVEDCTALVDLTALGALSGLSELTLQEVPNMSRIGWVSGCRGLHRLSVLYCNALRNLNGVEALTALSTLRVSSEKLVDVTALSHCTSLRVLSLSQCSKLREVRALGKLTALRRLSLDRTSVEDISWAEHLRCLRYMNVYACYCLRDLSPLMHLPVLAVVEASSSGVNSIKWVYEATAPLRMLSVVGCTKQFMVNKATLPAFVNLTLR